MPKRAAAEEAVAEEGRAGTEVADACHAAELVACAASELAAAKVACASAALAARVAADVGAHAAAENRVAAELRRAALESAATENDAITMAKVLALAEAKAKQEADVKLDQMQLAAAKLEADAQTKQQERLAAAARAKVEAVAEAKAKQVAEEESARVRAEQKAAAMWVASLAAVKQANDEAAAVARAGPLGRTYRLACAELARLVKLETDGELTERDGYELHDLRAWYNAVVVVPSETTQAAVDMDVDLHSAPGAAVSTATQPAAAAAGGDSSDVLGVSCKMQSRRNVIGPRQGDPAATALPAPGVGAGKPNPAARQPARRAAPRAS